MPGFICCLFACILALLVDWLVRVFSPCPVFFCRCLLFCIFGRTDFLPSYVDILISKSTIFTNECNSNPAKTNIIGFPFATANPRTSSGKRYLSQTGKTGDIETAYCMASDVTRSEPKLVGPVSGYCDWLRRQT